MAIFQKSVLNKFIKSQDSSKIDIAYQKFSEIFLQADRQAEIRSMKEEEYQDGFLDDLFVDKHLQDKAKAHQWQKRLAFLLF